MREICHSGPTRTPLRSSGGSGERNSAQRKAARTQHVPCVFGNGHGRLDSVASELPPRDSARPDRRVWTISRRQVPNSHRVIRTPPRAASLAVQFRLHAMV